MSFTLIMKKKKKEKNSCKQYSNDWREFGSQYNLPKTYPDFQGLKMHVFSIQLTHIISSIKL